MNTNEFLKATEDVAYITELGREFPTPRPHVICKDGYKISIQANEYTYCNPMEVMPTPEMERYIESLRNLKPTETIIQTPRWYYISKKPTSQ